MSITIPNPPDLPNTPGGNSAELAAQRRITSAFIRRLPVTVTLIPREKTPKPAGGFTWAEKTPRTPQVMTLIESPADPVPTRTLDGIVRVVQFELLGEWDAYMAHYDIFTHQGKDFEVIEIFHENGYERRALVSARG